MATLLLAMGIQMPAHRKRSEPGDPHGQAMTIKEWPWVNLSAGWYEQLSKLAVSLPRHYEAG